MLARLCALTIVHNENEKGKGKGKEVDDGSAAGAQAVACASLGEEGRTGCGYRQFSISPRTGLIMSKEMGPRDLQVAYVLEHGQETLSGGSPL